jgi:hypothetical protein
MTTALFAETLERTTDNAIQTRRPILYSIRWMCFASAREIGLVLYSDVALRSHYEGSRREKWQKDWKFRMYLKFSAVISHVS